MYVLITRLSLGLLKGAGKTSLLNQSLPIISSLCSFAGINHPSDCSAGASAGYKLNRKSNKKRKLIFLDYPNPAKHKNALNSENC